MSKFIENISILETNIFVLTPILVSFYKNLNPQQNNIFLAYFIFPIVLNQDCLKELKQFKTTSRISRITNSKLCMAGFQERFKLYETITNKCLQYAIDCKYIEINKDLSIKILNTDELICDPSLKESLRLSSRLFKIFKLDIINTYIAFGIKKL